MDGPSVSTMKFCEICLRRKLVTLQLLRAWGLVTTLLLTANVAVDVFILFVLTLEPGADAAKGKETWAYGAGCPRG
jgi:hypothetical protein